MNLPDLKEYRSDFIDKGTPYPLHIVPYDTNGLLSQLPSTPLNKEGWPWTEQTDPKVYDKKASWPKLTIVTPSYNQADFLEETIRSILLQNYPNLELIIIDGGSIDNSVEIIRKYSPWISYWQSKKDNGQGNAINLGFSLASGEYYAWVNSDDFYLKNVFKLIADTFIKHRVEFIYGYAYEFNVSQKTSHIIKVPPLLDYFLKIPTLVQPSTFWKSTIHTPIWEEMQCALDYELWLRLVKGKKRLRLKQPISVAQAHSRAKTSDPAMKVMWATDQSKMWSVDGHGPVPEWNRLVFLNRIRMKLYQLFRIV